MCPCPTLVPLYIHMPLVAGAPAARLLAQIHDELLFEVPEAQVGATAAAVRQVMEGRGLSVYCRSTAAVHLPTVVTTAHGSCSRTHCGSFP
jgi:hypothetical protein